MNQSKRNRLEALEKQLKHLESSPLYEFRQQHRYQPVFGEGDPDAEIMFIGEAPGAEEAKTGRPFVGRAGKVLDSLLESVELDREDVYITNIVKDRPPKNRDPQPNEIDTYSPFLEHQIEIIQPKVIATLGRFATDYILNRFDIQAHGQKIGYLHGKILEADIDNCKTKILPLYHPAAMFYNRDLQKLMEEDFQKLKAFV